MARYRLLHGTHAEPIWENDKIVGHIVYRAGRAKGPITDVEGKQVKDAQGQLMFEPGDIIENSSMPLEKWPEKYERLDDSDEGKAEKGAGHQVLHAPKHAEHEGRRK